MKALLTSILLLVALTANAQEPAVTTPDCIPHYKGGDEEMLKFLAKNIDLTGVEPEGTGGTVYVEVTIDTITGKVNNATLVKGINSCKKCNAEALRVVQLLEFIPCKVQDRFQNTSFTIPIRFKNR